MTSRIAVVGAGISGLAATRELLRAGYEVCLIEASDRVGGVLGSQQENGFLMERAASSFVPAESGAEKLARELGVPLEEGSDAQKRWVYQNGVLREVPTSTRKFLTGSLLSLRGKLRAIAEPLQPTHPGVDESIAEFFRRRLGDEIERKLIGPLVTGVFAGDSESLSLRACFPGISALEGRGGLVRGVAATWIEGAISKTSGEQYIRGRRLLAPVGGMQALVKALAIELEPNIMYSTSISSLEKLANGFLLHDAKGVSHAFDSVVLATPAYVSASLVRPHLPEMAQALREIPYVPMAVVGLGYSGPIPNFVEGFGFLVAKEESLGVLGVAMESSTWSGRAPDGGIMLRCMMGGARDPDVLDLSDANIIEQAKAALRKSMSISEEPVFESVVRWPRAIPQYTIGHLDRVERIERGATSLGIIVTGNAFGGVSVNECIAKGKTIVNDVVSSLENRK